MALLNYTTEVPVERTVAEIVEKLRATGASDVLLRYDASKQVCGVAFRIATPYGVIPFALPADTPKVEAVLRRQYNLGRVPRAATRNGQAGRTAWRILLRWLEGQLALIEIGLVTLDQVMLPYAVVGKNDETVYKIFAERQGFQKLLGAGA